MRLSGNRVGVGSSLVELTSRYVQVTVPGIVGIKNEENHGSGWFINMYIVMTQGHR